MDKNKKNTIISTCKAILSQIFLCIFTLNAQDPHFSQFYANPIYLNPAYSGSENCPRIIMNYRNQWPGLTGTFVTYSASFDQRVNLINGGIGVSVNNDKAGEGTLNTTNASFTYSYKKSITRNFSFSAGFEATYFQKVLDWEKLTFGDMIDPRYGFIYQTREVRGTSSKNGVDFSTGVVFFSNYFFGGIAIHHLSQPDEGIMGYSKLPAKYTLHSGAVLPLQKKESSISPNILFMQQAEFRQINFGLFIKHGVFVTGIWLRKEDSMIILVGLETGAVKVGYSYDITISKLNAANTGGSHEVSLRYRFQCNKKIPKPKEIDCIGPTF